MAMLKRVELWYPRLVPGKPNRKLDPNKPFWEVQIRTTSKEVKKEWEALNLKVHNVIPDKEDEKPYFKVNLRRRCFKKDGSAADPVEVMDGKMNPIDPATIGNGSIANVRIFQYEYPNKATNKMAIATMLTGVQLVKHVVYVPKDRDDDFEEEETETIEPEGSETPEFKPDDEIPF